jgi:phosphopantothenoylcysteine decarboxylase/phosphopantothenate--cysteine ligase
MEYAADKLQRKNLDYIIVNSLNDEGAGFANDTNKISVIDRDKKITHFTLKSKDQVAQDILGIILDKWREV